MITLPTQLQKEEFRFVKVQSKTKEPRGIGWQEKYSPNNYAYDNPAFLKYLEAGWNYGVLGGRGGLVIIDADSEVINNLVKEKLPETFTVKSTHPKLYKNHYYFILDRPFEYTDAYITMRAKGNPGELGSIRIERSMVIGPNCNVIYDLTLKKNDDIKPGTENCWSRVAKDLPITKIKRDTLTYKQLWIAVKRIRLATRLDTTHPDSCTTNKILDNSSIT